MKCAEAITTLAAGDRVIVNLTGRVTDRIHQWAGTIKAVDGVALRIEAQWYRLGLSPCMSDGEKVIPWNRIDYVQIADGEPL